MKTKLKVSKKNKSKVKNVKMEEEPEEKMTKIDESEKNILKVIRNKNPIFFFLASFLVS